MILRIVTRNAHKFEEAKEILENFGIEATQVKVPTLEIQSESLEEIARFRAQSINGKVEPPFATEDAGLFIRALGGFPGPFSSFVFKTIGCEGILKLLEGIEKGREAKFVSVVALLDRQGEVRIFKGELRGKISTEMRGTGGFGFDPIFIPEGFEGRTLAELGVKIKNKISHRAKSFSELARWILGSYPRYKDN